MAEAAREECQKIGVGVTLAIVDEYGYLRYLQRFDDAILPSIEIAQNKAYTAAVTRMTTAEFGKIAQPGESAFGINVTAPRLVIFGGGFPLICQEKIIGGIGVSGGSVAEDEQVAHAALRAFDLFFCDAQCSIAQKI
jgi:uncharacterized protein GlcG (DUF336 family)